MKRRAAFTLLELLVALTLFVFGIVTVIQVFPANRRLLTQTSQTTQAAFLAQEQLESLQGVAYSSLTVGTYAARATVNSNTSSPFNKFERQIDVVLLDTNRATTATDVGLKKATVTMYWTERNVSRTYTISTYVYR